MANYCRAVTKSLRGTLSIGYSHTVPEVMNTPTLFRTIGTEVKYKEIKTIIWVRYSYTNLPMVPIRIRNLEPGSKKNHKQKKKA